MTNKEINLSEQTARRWLHERGVSIQDIAELVLYLQKAYHDQLTIEECTHNVERVLSKREVQNAILTGIQLDLLAEKKLLEAPLQSIIETDEGLYGVDEILAFSIVNVYGSIGFTNYGYIDKKKPGILAKLNDKSFESNRIYAKGSANNINFSLVFIITLFSLQYLD